MPVVVVNIFHLFSPIQMSDSCHAGGAGSDWEAGLVEFFLSASQHGQRVNNHRLKETETGALFTFKLLGEPLCWPPRPFKPRLNPEFVHRRNHQTFLPPEVLLISISSRHTLIFIFPHLTLTKEVCPCGTSAPSRSKMFVSSSFLRFWLSSKVKQHMKKKKSSQKVEITDLICQTFWKWPGRQYRISITGQER